MKRQLLTTAIEKALPCLQDFRKALKLAAVKYERKSKFNNQELRHAGHFFLPSNYCDLDGPLKGVDPLSFVVLWQFILKGYINFRLKTKLPLDYVQKVDPDTGKVTLQKASKQDNLDHHRTTLEACLTEAFDSFHREYHWQPPKVRHFTSKLSDNLESLCTLSESTKWECLGRCLKLLAKCVKLVPIIASLWILFKLFGGE